MKRTEKQFLIVLRSTEENAHSPSPAGRSLVSLIKTAAVIHIDQNVWFGFLILQVYQILHPLTTTTHYPPTESPLPIERTPLFWNYFKF